MALVDLEKIPWMIYRSSLDLNRDLPLSLLVVKPINFLLFLAVIPTWVFGLSFRPELGVPLVGVLTVVISYVLSLALVLGRREYLHGNMIRESVFPGAIGLPEQARGALILVRSAEADLGDSVVNGEVWEVRSAFGDHLIPGQAATIVALDGATLLVTQQPPDVD